MAHDPKAQDVIAAQLGPTWVLLAATSASKHPYQRAGEILDALADEGLCVTSDCAAPTFVTWRHPDGKSCGLRGCPCMEHL